MKTSTVIASLLSILLGVQNAHAVSTSWSTLSVVKMSEVKTISFVVGDQVTTENSVEFSGPSLRLLFMLLPSVLNEEAFPATPLNFYRKMEIVKGPKQAISLSCQTKEPDGRGNQAEIADGPRCRITFRNGPSAG